MSAAKRPDLRDLRAVARKLQDALEHPAPRLEFVDPLLTRKQAESLLALLAAHVKP